MSNNYEERTTREITPKPRRPIHSGNEMGRYGMNTSNNKRLDSSTHIKESSQGIDVVDNVMSKMALPSRPVPMKIVRSNSYTETLQYSDDEGDINVLSKSLPDNLQASLYSSDDSDLEDAASDYHTQSRVEESSFYDRSSSLDSPQYSPERAPYTSRTDKETKNSNKTVFLFISVVICCVLAVSWQQFHTANGMRNKSIKKADYDEVVFENNMDNLKEKYNLDHNSILQIKTGLTSIFSRMDAGSFMFLYNSDTDTFDPKQFDKFINEVAHTAGRYLRNDIAPTHHTVIVSSSLDMQEHGELIAKYRDEVDRTGVLLVKDIDAVPSDLAMAFHYYCDEYDPLVKKSAIFFTLNLANCSNVSGNKSTHDFVEKCLAKKWKSVPSENIRPLLTRIVDIIIDVTKVF